ncbi:MAG TPA: hypothetical protein VJT09_07435 [Pyrinomonadaceae bacterium]|nr:hypothetical protein [Pyrinomonadaceae bacterium]
MVTQNINSLPKSVVVTFLLCFLVAYFATGVGEGLFVTTSIFSFAAPDSKLPIISLGIFILVPPLAFIIGGFILFRLVKVDANEIEMKRGWKRKFVLWSIITLVLNYLFAIFLAGLYLKPLEGVISYILDHAPDW